MAGVAATAEDKPAQELAEWTMAQGSSPTYIETDLRRLTSPCGNVAFSISPCVPKVHGASSGNVNMCGTENESEHRCMCLQHSLFETAAVGRTQFRAS